MIHCVDEEDGPGRDPDVVLPIEFPCGDIIEAAINVRPYVQRCLTNASEHYQVIVFTASHQSYADAILDYIDPEGLI